MNSFILYLLMGAPQGGEGAAGGGNPLMTFLPFVAIIAIFYFLIIRPQNRKQKETQKMLAALKKGDKVVTIGGIHGTIQTVREQTVIVKVDEDTKLEFSRSAISTIQAAAKEEDKKETEEAGEKS
jgi:preprotein translocase subunit YajC